MDDDNDVHNVSKWVSSELAATLLPRPCHVYLSVGRNDGALSALLDKEELRISKTNRLG